ncbi:MAG TPA: hypothetical protein ENN29_01850 [Candidatus Hydrogenedentes bacterium]|nr:hypothetical protein [Candidatus Hydrogenedentota bacterium]
MNRSYEELAAYYGCALLPARMRKPKDKAKVEKGVQDVERRIVVALRHHTKYNRGLGKLQDRVIL